MTAVLVYPSAQGQARLVDQPVTAVYRQVCPLTEADGVRWNVGPGKGPMEKNREPAEFNRRQILGLGAVGVGTLGMAGFGALASASPASAVTVGPNPVDPTKVSGDTVSFPSGVSAATTGLAYSTYGYFAFYDLDGTRTLGSGIYPKTNGFLFAPINLPTGARVLEYSVWGRSSISSFSFGPTSYAADGNSFTNHAATTIANGTTNATEQKVATDFTISEGRQYFLEAYAMATDGSQGVYGARIGYTTNGSIVLVPSSRVLNNTIVPNGTSVVADCSGVVPAGAKAALVTILAFATTSDGYLTCHADGTASPGTINCYWAAGAQTATAALVPLSVARRMRLTLTTTGGAVGVAVDIAGYLL